MREVLRVCDVLGRMYQHWTGAVLNPDKDVTISWGDGILYDADKTWADYMAMVAAGMLKPEIALAWKFDLSWETPEDLAKIREKYMPEIKAMTGGGGDETPIKTGGISAQDDVVNNAEDVVGKTLNGAQTQSLVAVVAQVQSGQLSVGQAVNIISISIGISKEEAQKIIEGAI